MAVTLRGSHEFLIENYSGRKEIGAGGRIESESFTVGGCKWTIFFYPDGYTEAARQKGFASLFVCLRSVIVYPVTFRFEFWLRDQSGKGNHKYFSYSPDRRAISSSSYGSLSGFVNFIERASIEPSDYLKDDCLIIVCNIEILPSHIQARSDMGLWQYEEEADVFFKVEGERFCAHMSLLQNYFQEFLSLLPKANQQNEIVISHIERRVFKAVLQFIYTGTFVEEKDSAGGDSFLFLSSVLRAAHRYKLEELKRRCQLRIVKWLPQGKVADLLTLAKECDAELLREAYYKFLAEKGYERKTISETHEPAKKHSSMENSKCVDRTKSQESSSSSSGVNGYFEGGVLHLHRHVDQVKGDEKRRHEGLLFSGGEGYGFPSNKNEAEAVVHKKGLMTVTKKYD